MGNRENWPLQIVDAAEPADAALMTALETKAGWRR